MAVSTKGTTISYATGGSPATALIGNVFNMGAVAKQMEHLDSKDLDSSGPAYVPSGITEYEPIDLELYYVAGNAAQVAMEAKIGSTSTTTFTITVAGSPQLTYTVVGYVQRYERGPFAVNSVIESRMTILPTSIT